MNVTIHQPEHLPWLGFCNKADQADVLVLLDTVQFRKNYFQNRNQILGSNGPQWLTVPVHLKGHMSGTIQDIRIDTSSPWRDKCKKAIFQAYHKHRYYSDYCDIIERTYATDWERLADLNEFLIRELFAVLDIHPQIIRASSLHVEGRNSELLANICRALGASRYLAGQCGRQYLDESFFQPAGIEVEYHYFHHPRYAQRGMTEFVSNMSVIDLLFNCGPESLQVIRSGSRGGDIPAGEEPLSRDTVIDCAGGV